EPGAGIGFSRKMSLKGRIGMLGIDDQHGRFGTNEPGGDPGVSGGSRAGRVCRPEARGDLPVGGPDPAGAGLRATGPRGRRMGAAVRGEDDGTEPGASRAADSKLLSEGRSESAGLSAAPVRLALHGG